MAGAQVSDTPELLELVLEHLPCNDLLLAQRVNRVWRDTVQGSKKLKRALYLEPAGPPLHGEGWGEHPSSGIAQHTIGNPFMEKVFPRGNYSILGTTKQQIEALNRPNASWRKMLISQPPVKQFCAEVHELCLDLTVAMPGACVPLRRAILQGGGRSETVMESMRRKDTGLTMQDLLGKSEGVRYMYVFDVFTHIKIECQQVTAHRLPDLMEPYDWAPVDDCFDASGFGS